MTLPPFPRIPHLPGSHAAADDLVLQDEELQSFLDGEICAVEKLDGVNVAVAIERGELVYQVKRPWQRAFDRTMSTAIDVYFHQRMEEVHRLLSGGRVLYGEWLWHRVSVAYEKLPDVFVAFALTDQKGGLLPVLEARSRIVASGLTPSLLFWRGRASSVAELKRVVGRLRGKRSSPTEGAVFERMRPADVRYAKWVEKTYRHVKAGVLAGDRNGMVRGVSSTHASRVARRS